MLDLPIWSITLLIWALIGNWPPAVLMWVCWGQGVCFVLFTFLRVLFYRRDKGWYKYNFKQLFLGNFMFLILNLTFYLFYFVFITKIFEETIFDHRYIQAILIPIGLFILSHLFFIVYRMIKGEEAIINGNFLARALSRIVPMHLMIIGAGCLKGTADLNARGVLLLLLVLKTFSDAGIFVYSIKGLKK